MMFLYDQRVTPAFVEVFEFVRASKLKLLKDFEDESKPTFSLVAEELWSAVESFPMY